MTEQKLDQCQVAAEQANPKYLWHSGQLVEWERATIHISKLGWTAISAVFEGIRAYWNADHQELYIFQLDAHLKRLFQSMKIMRMTCSYPQEELRDGIIELLRANDYRCDTYVQPLAYFAEGIPGYLAVLQRPGEVAITTRSAPSNQGTERVAHCNVSSWTRISDNVMPPRAKAIANYQNSRYVSTESRINGYDFGIVLNQRGKVSEANYACIYIIRDGVAITPPVSADVLESITSGVVQRLLGQEMEVQVLERDVDRTELYIADEAFVCGTAVEIQAIGSIDRYEIGQGGQGPLVAKLSQLFYDIARGVDPRHADWRTPVYASGPTP